MLKKARTRRKTKGQSMVEFALALPIVLLIVFGIIEFGYMLFVWSSVNTASRNAARYGIAVGDVDGDLRYYDCDGIIEAGLSPGKYAGIVDTDFAITYDHGPDDTTEIDDCAGLAADALKRDAIVFGDRIIVTVAHEYRPLISFMGLDVGPFTMTSQTSRTIVRATTILADH